VKHRVQIHSEARALPLFLIFQVALRIRPLSDAELEEGATIIAHKVDDQVRGNWSFSYYICMCRVWHKDSTACYYALFSMKNMPQHFWKDDCPNVFVFPICNFKNVLLFMHNTILLLMLCGFKNIMFTFYVLSIHIRRA